MSADVKFKGHARIDDLAARIEAAHKGVDASTNATKDEDLFRRIATADGRNVDQMISDDEYRSDYIAGQTLAHVRISKRHMADNKDCQTVSGTYEIGRNKLEIVTERHQRVPNRVLDKESGNFKVDGEKDLWGETTIKYQVRGARNSKGELKAVREFSNESFKSAFSS